MDAGAGARTVSGGGILLEPGTAALAKGQLVLLHWTRDTATELRAGRVAAIQTISALDGANYLRAEIEPVPVLDPLVELAAVEVLSPTVSAHPNLFAVTPIPDTTHIILDAFYPGLAG
jgi:hypothetical protein